MTAMVLVSTLTWLPLGVAPLALMVGRTAGTAVDDARDERSGEGWLLLLVAVVAQTSVVSAPLMHVAGGRNLRRGAAAFFLCQRHNKVGNPQGRRHGVDWGGHVHPTLPEVIPEIAANPVSFYSEGGG